VEAAGRHCHSHNGQGSQAYLSLPSSCLDVSYVKQGNKAHIIALDSVRKNEMAREPARAAESVTSPRANERPPGDGAGATDMGAWGRWKAPRGF